MMRWCSCTPAWRSTSSSLLTTEVALRVEGLAALQASYDVKLEEQHSMRLVIHGQMTKALQEATAKAEELVEERRRVFALEADKGEMQRTQVALQDEVAALQRSVQGLKVELVAASLEAHSLKKALEEEKIARQKLEQAVASPVVNKPSFLLEAREAKLQHVEVQLSGLFTELQQLKQRLACKHETYGAQVLELLGNEEKLLGEVAKHWGNAEAATAAGAKLQAELDETVRQAVADALEKERV